MPLTDEEREQVIESMLHYPTGIDSNSWGHGDLEYAKGEPSDCDRETLLKCG